jgi:alpha-D-ribose 1-methylphosphonate 5-triphosphate synthase subunit PhnG
MQGLFEQRAKEIDLSATARLHWYARLTSTHAENINKLVPVFDALYQTRSESQKKAADAVFEQLRQRRAARRAQ